MSTLVAQTLSNGTVSTSTANCIQGSAKAWVNFNGTVATPSTIRGSYNVTSITKNGTGDYTVNFTNALPDANYAVSVTTGGTGGLAGAKSPIESTSNTTTTCRIATFTQSGVTDMVVVNVAVFSS